MGRNAKNDHSNLGETLTTLLLPIARLMLKGGLGFGELIRAAKQAYVRAAIAHVFPAGSRINASRLSVVTGLTRKEISALVSQSVGRSLGSASVLKEQRAFRVLRGWAIDPRFHNSKGEPARLALRGDRRSFSLLVKLYGGDVTPNSVLKELERMNAVRSNQSGDLSLRAVRGHVQSIQRMSELGRLFSDFANTVSQERSTGRPPVFFGFRDSIVSSPDQAARFQRTFSNRAAALFEGVEQWLANQSLNTNRHTRAICRQEECRVGIGIYLIQSQGTHSLAPAINGSDKRHG